MVSLPFVAWVLRIGMIFLIFFISYSLTLTGDVLLLSDAVFVIQIVIEQ